MDWRPWFLNLLIQALRNLKTCYTVIYSFPAEVFYLNPLYDIQNHLTLAMHQLDNLELIEAYFIYEMRPGNSNGSVDDVGNFKSNRGTILR